MFREVIVIHNFKEVENLEILNHVWQEQVIGIYKNGKVQHTIVAAQNPISGKLEEKDRYNEDSKLSHHPCISTKKGRYNEDSKL